MRFAGIIQLPNERLVFDAGEPIADQSAYNAIVARRIELYTDPDITLNTGDNAAGVAVLNDIPVKEWAVQPIK